MFFESIKEIEQSDCLGWVFGVWVEIGFGGKYLGVYLLVDVAGSGDSMD